MVQTLFKLQTCFRIHCVRQSVQRVVADAQPFNVKLYETNTTLLEYPCILYSNIFFVYFDCNIPLIKIYFVFISHTSFGCRIFFNVCFSVYLPFYTYRCFMDILSLFYQTELTNDEHIWKFVVFVSFLSIAFLFSLFFK